MAAAGSFSVYAKTLTGSTAEVRTSPDETIAALKEKIESALKLTVPILRLVYDSKELTDTQTVGEHGIAKESIIIVVIGSSKPCHFFFALDESGSMSGGRWQQLLNSFQDFVIARHKDAEKKGTKIVDRVSVFFHETGCRVASWRKPSGEVVPFDDIPLADVTPESLVNDFRSGGNDFFTVLSFLTPYLRKSAADYIPVLMFMTDGGDCGVRERGYQKIKELKEELKDMVLYVTVVYTTSQYDIDGGKQLCLAAGFDVETFFTYIPGNESQGHYGSPMGLSAYPGFPSPAPGCPLGAPPGYGSPTSYGPPPSYGCPPPSYGPPLPSSPVFSLPSSPYPSMALSSAPPSLASSPASISPYTSAPPSSMPSPGSAQQLMAKQWEHAYQCTSSYVPR